MSGNSQLRVRFTTNYQEYRVSDTPFAVPSKLGRNGLTEVINHLLGSEQTIVFDFLISGKLLRVPLIKFISESRISTEDIIVIEYFPALSFSDEIDNINTPSWVGCLDSNDIHAIAGCYDGHIKVFDSHTMKEIGSLNAHNDPIRTILARNYDTNEEYKSIFTASKDQSIKYWHYKSIATRADNFELVATMIGHVNSIESLSMWKNEYLLSGDWSGNIFAWDLKIAMNSASNDDVNQNTKKKRKVNDSAKVTSNIIIHKPVFTIKAHTQSVSGISINCYNDMMLTCSWDHSLKIWDLERQDNVSTLMCSKVFTSLDCLGLQHNDTILTSHPDGKIRLWDSRIAQETSSAKSSYGKTNNWISQVKWNPTEDNVFASTDYSGMVTLFDTRSSIPLSCKETHSGKSLCLAWITDLNKKKLVSGGSDNCLKVTHLS